MKKTLLLLTMAVLCMVTIASADTYVTSGSRASFTTDFIDWGQLGPPGNFVNTPAFVVSFGGTNAALVGDASLGQFLTAQQGVTWGGNFDYGENLVWTGNPNLVSPVGGGGPFVIQLANPVGGIGFGIQADLYGPFTASVGIYDKNLNFQTTLTFSGVSNALGNGSNLFIGIQDTTAVNIGAVIIDTLSSGYPWDHDFALDAVSFNYSTPEPGTLLLLGSGLIGAAGLVRRKLGR